MKISTLFVLLFTVSILNAQSLPFDFESSITTANFQDFDGGTATVIANPQSNGINTSATVAQIVRDGGEIWAGSKIILTEVVDFTTMNAITMKVFTTAPIGTTVKFKLEGIGSTERDMLTTVTNEWETLTWDFTGTSANFNSIVFMFDFGNVGDGSASSTFLFDDVEQLFGGTHIDLPVDFEGAMVNYTMSDFGGNISSLTADPTDPTNMVMQVIKPEGSATWAGTTIGTPAGFATNIPLTLTDSKMTVRVWSPEANTPIRLKVEDSDDPTHTCETETNTTVAGDWETIEFDFTNQAPGTELLSVGLSMGWTYNMASIFFNFGTEGSTAGEKTYYFDDVYFGVMTSTTSKNEIQGLSVFPNPSNGFWTIAVEDEKLKSVEIFDLQGRLLGSYNPDNRTARINTSNFSNGMYFSRISTKTGTSVVRLVKE